MTCADQTHAAGLYNTRLLRPFRDVEDFIYAFRSQSSIGFPRTVFESKGGHWRSSSDCIAVSYPCHLTEQVGVEGHPDLDDSLDVD